MELFTFQGSSPAEALKKAQQELGTGALVVNTKEIKKKTLSKPALYEVTFVIDKKAKTISPNTSHNQSQAPNLANIQDDSKDDVVLDLPKTQEKSKNSVAERLEQIAQKQILQKKQQRMSMDNVAKIKLSEAIKETRKILNTDQDTSSLFANKSSSADTNNNLKSFSKEPKSSHTDTLQSPQKHSKLDNQDLDFKKELSSLSDRISLIQDMIWQEKSPKGDIQVPKEFAQIYKIITQSGVRAEHIDEVMRLTIEVMPLKMRSNYVLVKRYFREVLRKMIYISKGEFQSNKQRNIIMFVGPTGVGKTTTIAKLAARYSMMLKENYKVGLITLDTYRIGAVDQLMFYAKKMRLSIDTVNDPQEFKAALDSLQYCDYVLIDTVGSSQYDTEKVDRLKEFIQGEKTDDIHTSLVLAANTKFEDLIEIHNKFSILDVESLVFTKLDETLSFGNIFSLVYEIKRPIRYFSVGQEVPNDIRLASSDYLVDCLLNGFNKDMQ